jgi:hypothetical protein
MGKYRIKIIAEARSSLSKTDLESRLVVSIFDVETEQKVADGENKQLEIVDYELTEALPIDKSPG